MARTSTFNKCNGGDLEVVPVVTNAAYAAGNVIGGPMRFAGVLSEDFFGIIQSLTVKFKGSVVAGGVNVAIFSAQPSGSYADKSAPVISAADSALLLGIYNLPTPSSILGTHTIYQLDLFGRPIIGTSPDLWAVVTVVGTPTPASTSDMSVRLGINL
jgi:hypothetical protein